MPLHAKFMYNRDEEETPASLLALGVGRGRGLLVTSHWSLDSTAVVGRTTLVDTVHMAYGRPRGDAGTYPMECRALAGQRWRGSTVGIER